MITFLMVLSILLVLFSGFVCWQVLEQRKVIARMMENDDIADSEQEPELVITLRVLNPIALAKRESRSARVLADKLPVMVRKWFSRDPGVSSGFVRTLLAGRYCARSAV